MPVFTEQIFFNLLIWRNHSHSVILWNCEEDTISPSEEEAPQGGKPPKSPVLSFSFRRPFPACSTGRGSMRPRAPVVPSQINLWSLTGFAMKNVNWHYHWGTLPLYPPDAMNSRRPEGRPAAASIMGFPDRILPPNVTGEVSW